MTGQNINIAWSPDGRTMAVGNKVCVCVVCGVRYDHTAQPRPINGSITTITTAISITLHEHIGRVLFAPLFVLHGRTIASA